MEIGSARVTCPTPQQLRGIPPMQQGGGNNHLAVDDFTGGPRDLSCHNPGDFNTCGSLPYHHGDMSSGCDSAASSLPLPHHGNEEEWLDISQLSSCGQSYPSSVASLSPSIDSQYGGGGVLYPGDHSNTSFGSQGGYRVPSPDSGFFASGEASLPGAMLHADPAGCYTQDPYHHHHTPATSAAAAPVVYAKTWNQGFVPPPFSVGVQKSAAAKRQKRKRVINKTQRTAANHRERKRMVTLNDAFGHLQEKIPKFADDKKISRIETLRVAISYIGFMTDLVNGKTPEVDTQSIERMLSRCNAGL